MQKILGHERHDLTTYLSRVLILLAALGLLFSQVSIQPARAAGTDLNLTKTVEGGVTTAQVGDVIRYRIHFACSNLVTPCGPMEITDVLQPGLIYQPPPASSVPAGFSISYDAPTRTITITKDDNNLLDGSQYDAVIAVRVDYDLRPLPAIINNTVNGRIAPTGPGNWESTTPASAPPIEIGTVTPSWALTKSLASPTINPTVNTDVTYRLRLCPGTPPAGQGNVPLRNVTFTDTLPPGAVFVSASDGGTESGGIVTWPAYVGSVVPPNCLTRYVTIRYNSPPFNIDDNVTNTASVDGQYRDSSGATISPGDGLGSDPIDHPIDAVYESPNYSKDDAGDPIGFTGTGRFILNLNTIGTNYPSNQLILVDHLPPQLRVTSVTSGQWSPDFDFVRAYVEYSTNNGSSYTAFPNQPIGYNANAALPAAVAGNTYDNCLQVSRINSQGNAITDPCDTEPLTVNGTYVSLRTSKSETPGGMWDDVGEAGIDGVTVNLYAAGDLTTILETQTTADGGYYIFNNLLDGDYMVSIAASNFSGVLRGYWSSATSRAANGSVVETPAAAANTDVDSDDNGTLQTGGALNGAVVSSVITLGPDTLAEPPGEADLDGGSQGQPDTQANMTVDFGFYTITLGDLVWRDLDNSGLFDGAETGIDAVTVELRSGDGSTLLGTTTTSGGGVYTFNGLPAGDYLVRLPAVNFNPGGILRDYRSSTGPLPAIAYEPAPDADLDTTNSDDNGTEANGLLGLGGYIETLPVTLLPGLEESLDHANGRTSETRVDFGVNNSPQIDLSVTKTDHQAFYMAGGILNYDITVTNRGPADANGMTVSDTLPAQIESWTWTCDAATPAAYNCTGAASNSSDFSGSLDLPQLASVTYNVTAQVASDASGSLTNSVIVVTPTGMTDMTPPDNTATDTDLPASLIITKDDGVDIVAPDFTTSYTLTVTNNGDIDLTGIALADAIPAGMSFVSSSGGGTFSSGQIAWPLFDLLAHASTTFTVRLKVADAASLGGITSFTNTVHVQDDGTHTAGKPVESQDTDTDTLASSNVKTLTYSNQAASSTPNVLIGEILTYSIRLDVPVGTLMDLKAVDVLDHGLAFVGCDATTPVSSGSLNLGQDPCATPGAITVQAQPTTDTSPTSAEAGRHITFDFGTVQNNGSSTQALIVNYQVVVLNINSNVNGVKGLNNQVEWQWAGGRLSGSASDVDIVEPQLAIVKTVDPQVAAIGSIVTYTLEISHTSASTAPAFDVLVTDGLPAGLTLVPGSITVNGSSGLPAPAVASTPAQFTVHWTSFPMGEKATITFQAAFVGPSPAVNTATVEWSSIQIDPNPHMTPQSPYNRFSTERCYDPPSQTTNDYQASSSARLRIPTLPETGFAPHIQTSLPAQPRDKLYAATDIVIEIPSLGIRMPIVGIPKKGGSWDVTWLNNQAGWLEGTSFPSWNGNSVLTAHVYQANGLPGPFVNLNRLKYGDRVIIHAYGQRYIFGVTNNTTVEPKDMSAFRHEEKPVLTLITCKVYDPATGTYLRRVVVRAVLMEVSADP